MQEAKVEAGEEKQIDKETWPEGSEGKADPSFTAEPSCGMRALHRELDSAARQFGAPDRGAMPAVPKAKTPAGQAKTGKRIDV